MIVALHILIIVHAMGGEEEPSCIFLFFFWLLLRLKLIVTRLSLAYNVLLAYNIGCCEQRGIRCFRT